jgi:thioredoxin-related protein
MKWTIGKHKSRSLPVIVVIIALALISCFIVFTWLESGQTEDEISWHKLKDIETAQGLVFINVVSGESKACAAMDEHTYSRQHIADIIEHNYFAIRVDVEDSTGTELCNNYGVTICPTILILDADTYEELERLEGFVDERTLKDRLLSVLASRTVE